LNRRSHSRTVRDLLYPEQRLAALGQQTGFAVLSLAPPFQRYADEQRVSLHGFGENLGNGHWNAEGHRLAGELISDTLCTEVLAS